jgi:hypothetical protein
MFVPLFLETPENVPRPVSDKYSVSSDQDGFIAQNQKISPQKALVHCTKPKNSPTKKPACFQLGYSQMPGKRISALEFSNCFNPLSQCYPVI